MDRMNKLLALYLTLTLIASALGGCDTNPGKPAADAVPTNDAQTKIAEFESQLGPNDVKSFGGGDHIPIGGPVASTGLLPSKDEAQFLAEYGCVDEVDCYGRGKFDRYIVKTYPDIARVRFKLPPELADDEIAEFLCRYLSHGSSPLYKYLKST